MPWPTTRQPSLRPSNCRGWFGVIGIIVRLCIAVGGDGKVLGIGMEAGVLLDTPPQLAKSVATRMSMSEPQVVHRADRIIAHPKPYSLYEAAREVTRCARVVGSRAAWFGRPAPGVLEGAPKDRIATEYRRRSPLTAALREGGLIRLWHDTEVMVSF